MIAFESAAGRWVLAVAVLGSGMAFLDGTVVNVALPDIGRDLGASTSALQWVLNGYLLTLASLILLGGSLGDRYGRRRDLRARRRGVHRGVAAVRDRADSGLLVAARMLAGNRRRAADSGQPGDDRGAASGPGPRPRDRRLVGPRRRRHRARAAARRLPGQAVSWRAIFLINLPLGLFVVALATRHVPETRDPTASGRLDYRGATLAATRARRHDVRADRGAGKGMAGGRRVGRRRRRPRARRLSRRRARAARTR